jgi:hypothetical protein
LAKIRSTASRSATAAGSVSQLRVERAFMVNRDRCGTAS